MKNFDSSILDAPEGQIPATNARNGHYDVLHHGSASEPTSLRQDTQYSSTPQFKVFISHAGDDKATIAIPLRDMLAKQNIRAFVDDCDIERGKDAIDAMEHAMKTAQIAVIVLSPEFVARKWPIKELMCFLRRYKECKELRLERPKIIPFFYRLSIDEMYHEPNFDCLDKHGSNLYKKSRFRARQANGEIEADPVAIKKALKSLHRFMGVENSYEANNDSSHRMTKKRELILEELCREVCKAAGRTKEGKVKDLDVSPTYLPPEVERSAMNPNELNRHANSLRDGAEGTERNVKKAVELYRLAVKDGHVGAMNNLANLLRNGANGVERNGKEAMELYQRAIKSGHVRAMNNLALLLQGGAEGVEPDAEEAVKLYRRAVKNDDVLAMNNLANLLVNGAEGVERNPREAVELYRRAIDRGNVPAMNNLANLLANGADGVERNEKEAKDLYRRAIKKFHSGARNNLANLLRRATDDESV